LNNPLIYYDPSGEYWLVDDIIAGVIGGGINLISNAIQGNIHSLEQKNRKPIGFKTPDKNKD